MSNLRLFRSLAELQIAVDSDLSSVAQFENGPMVREITINLFVEQSGNARHPSGLVGETKSQAGALGELLEIRIAPPNLLKHPWILLVSLHLDLVLKGYLR